MVSFLLILNFHLSTVAQQGEPYAYIYTLYRPRPRSYGVWQGEKFTLIVAVNYNNLPRGTELKAKIFDVLAGKEIGSTIVIVEGDAINYSIPVQLVAEASPECEFMHLRAELWYKLGGVWTHYDLGWESEIVIRVYLFDHLQITSVEFPKVVRKGETFTVGVTLQYNFPKVSNASLVIMSLEEWTQGPSALPYTLTPVGSTLQLEGKGTKTLFFQLTAPTDEVVMNLIAIATYHHIDPQLYIQLPGMAWFHYWHDEKGWNKTFSIQVKGTLPTEDLRITSIDYPPTAKPGEPFNVKVHIDYSFQEATQIFIGIWDEDLEEYMPTEPTGYLELQGTGTKVVSLKLIAPPEKGTMNLIAEGWYLKDQDWTHGGEWYKRFKVEVSSVQAAIHGYVMDGHGHPLENVMVHFYWNGKLVKTVYTNSTGEFRVEDPILTVPAEGKGFFEVDLIDKDTIIEIHDCQASEDRVAYARFPEFEIKTEADLEQNLVFPVDAADDPSTQDIREDHLDDLAYIYYNTYLALRFYRDKLKVTFGKGGLCDHTPLIVYAFKNENEVYFSGREGDRGIHIGWTSSEFDEPDAPVNREWHEFSHFVMWDIYEGFPPTHYKRVSRNPDSYQLVDENHGGFNNHCTTDSWAEGFAIFMPLAIRNELYPLPETISVLGSLYPIGDALILLEINILDDLMVQNSDSHEDLSVASILWDLYDGLGELDEDKVDLTIEQIWKVISQTHEFPVYYSWNDAKGEFVWVGDKGSKENRHIHYVKDLYDSFVASGLAPKKDIDAIFISHGFYSDENKNNRYDEGEPVGFGDANRPERRCKELDPSSSIVIKVPSEVLPAVLAVEIIFDPPFEEYSYAYEINITESPQKVLIFLPPTNGYNVTAYFIVKKEGHYDSEPLTITNGYYWENVGRDEQLIIHEFTLASAGLSGGLLLIAGLTIFVGLGVVLLKRTLRRRKVSVTKLRAVKKDEMLEKLEKALLEGRISEKTYQELRKKYESAQDS